MTVDKLAEILSLYIDDREIITKIVAEVLIYEEKNIHNYISIMPDKYTRDPSK